MSRAPRTPADIASRLSARRGRETADELRQSGTWRRQTFRLPRGEARETAKAWFEQLSEGRLPDAGRELAPHRGRADRVHHAPPADRGLRGDPHGHLTVGGIEERIESTLPPVLRPKIVPRS